LKSEERSRIGSYCSAPSSSLSISESLFISNVR
jgi:hypothetical protein